MTVVELRRWLDAQPSEAAIEMIVTDNGKTVVLKVRNFARIFSVRQDLRVIDPT
jgi:hypothetical protein